MQGIKQYRVKADGWVAGLWRATESILPLTEKQAKYENVEPVQSKKASAKQPKTPKTNKATAEGAADT